MTETKFEQLINEQNREFTKLLDTIHTINIMDQDKAITLFRCADVMKIANCHKQLKPNNDLIVKQNLIINNAIRSCLYFTREGLAKFLHENDVRKYEDMCQYFGIVAVNKQWYKWDAQLDKFAVCVDGCKKYDTKLLLRWLFDKRKSIKILGEHTTIETLMKTLSEEELTVIDEFKKDYMESKITIKN